jgi:hypothetical protein
LDVISDFVSIKTFIEATHENEVRAEAAVHSALCVVLG